MTYFYITIATTFNSSVISCINTYQNQLPLPSLKANITMPAAGRSLEPLWTTTLEVRLSTFQILVVVSGFSGLFGGVQWHCTVHSVGFFREKTIAASVVSIWNLLMASSFIVGWKGQRWAWEGWHLCNCTLREDCLYYSSCWLKHEQHVVWPNIVCVSLTLVSIS